MTNKECGQKWLRKDVSGHVIRRDPDCGEKAISNVLTNEMMPNIDMFGPGGNDICVGNGTGTLVVTVNRKRFWRR